MGCVGPRPGTPPSESDSHPADALITGIFDFTLGAVLKRRVNRRPAADPPKVRQRPARCRVLSRALACGGARDTWPLAAGDRVSTMSPGHARDGRVRRPFSAAEPPAPGITRPHYQALLTAARQSARATRFRLHGIVLTGARPSFEPLAAPARACATPRQSACSTHDLTFPHTFGSADVSVREG